MIDSVSVSQWIGDLKAGDADAVQALWDRYSARLVQLARRRLGEAPKRMGDEEDVALTVFNSLCRGAAAGRLADVKDRDDLWWLLLAITRRKVANHVRRETAQKRGGGRTASKAPAADESSAAELLDQLIGDEPTPDLVAMLAEQTERLMAALRDDVLRKIAAARIEGYTVAEIAADLGISVRSVERKLQLIRSTWAKELAAE